VGNRIVELEFETRPSTEEEAFLREVAAFAEFHGVGAITTPPRSYPGLWELVLDANSSYLNDFTPYFIESMREIAMDINPDSPGLVALVNYVSGALEHQVVAWSGRDGITFARPLRELEQRVAGEGSYSLLDGELDLHEHRLRDGLAEYDSLTGPSAWRHRHDLRLAMRVDALALTGAARRLRRIAGDLAQRIPGAHIRTALETFDRAAPDLVHLRDIAEHIDEYSVGRGRIDKVELEPGDVFEMTVAKGDLILAARGRQVSITKLRRACAILAACLSNAAHHQLTWGMVAWRDFDFVTETEEGPRFVPRQEETHEQAELRAALSQRPAPVIPETRCDGCGNIL
jgi:hypothetical protein